VKQLKKGLKVLLIVMLAYLCQVCVMEHLEIFEVSGSVIFAVLAILTVTCGKKYVFCASCMIGMMMESMLSNVPALYVIAYPLISMLCAQAFADMSERQRERRRMNTEARQRRREGKKPLLPGLIRLLDTIRGGELPVHLRIPLCAGLMDLIMNVVLCVYMYLIGVELGLIHAARLLVKVTYTVGLALALMVPMRYILGMYRRNKQTKRGEMM